TARECRTVSMVMLCCCFFFSSRRRHTRCYRDWSSDVCSSDLGQKALDVGCGVGTTAIQMARRFGVAVTAVDISPLMLERARRNVQRAGLRREVEVEQGDILALRFADSTFDRVIAEAVTMFVDRQRAAKELVRVCRPGGMVLATEFFWRQPPTEEAREIFLGQVCP